MTYRWKITASVAAVIATAIAVPELIGSIKERSRQRGYEQVLLTYSRDLPRGSSRIDVEKFVRSHGGEPMLDPQPYGDLPHSLVVPLGDAPAPWYCSRVIFYLEVKFDQADKFRDVSLKPEAQDCL